MTEPEPQLPQLELLRRQLRSPSRGTGYRAADELVRSGADGVEMIKRALESRDRNVRVHAAWAVRLLDSPRALRQLITLLRDDREFYLPLQQALPAEPTPDVLEPLLKAAVDPKNRNRKFHVMLLGDVVGEGVLDALLGALQSDDQILQEGAFLAFKHAGEWLRQQAARPLVQALSVRLPLPARLPWSWTKRARARQSAPLALIAAVGMVSGSDGVGVLTEILRSEAHLDYRLASISGMVTVGEEAVGRCWQPLLSVAEEPVDDALTAAAAEALRRMRVTDAESRLLALLESGKAFLRRNAAHALEGCLTAASLESLQQAIGDPDPHVRRTVARTLGRLPESSRRLLEALSDHDRWVGWNAAWALGRHQLPELIPALLDGLNSPDKRRRRNSAEALGQLRISSPEVIESLVAVLEERSSYVPRSAAWALRCLDLAEAIHYACQLLDSPDPRRRRLGQRSVRWLRPERASYTPHLPVRSSRLGGVVFSPEESR